MAQFPVHYVARPYQETMHQAFRKYRYSVIVHPRQSGKDVAASMEQCHARLTTPKTTGVYVSLTNPTIRDILWDKTYLDPASGQFIRGLQDNVPADYVDWKDTVMEGRFSNKSRLKLQGYFQSGQDKSGVGTSYQDYTITELALFQREDPIPRLMPILENRAEQKRLMVVSTPRGKRRNPLWLLMESLKDNPEAIVITRTIEDLNEIMRKEGLPPILTQEELERIQDAYLKRFGNSRMFDQEYHCSFEEMDAAAVYGEAYATLLADGRAYEFRPNDAHPIYVMFDIGSAGIHSDATSWIAFQWINGRLWLYDSGEGHGKALPEYVDHLRMKHWFPKLARIILPWDAEHHEKSVTTTPADMVREKFPNVSVLAKSGKVWKLPNSRQGDYDLVTDIQQTRMQLYNTIIHPTNCDWVMECLEQYKYEFDTKRQEWTSKPLHDRYSHMMDTLRYIVQATKEIDFFGSDLQDSLVGAGKGSSNYTEDWSGVWR